MNNREYIPVSDAAKLADVTKQAIYNLIDKRKIPFAGESFGGGSRRYGIPVIPFLVWLEKSIAWHEDKARHLKKSHQKLKEYVNYG